MIYHRIVLDTKFGDTRTGYTSWFGKTTLNSDPPSIPPDVRMKGFRSRSTVEEAIAWIDSHLPAFSELAMEEVLLSEASGRVLAHDIVSEVDVPGFPRSMMDGFALRSDETYGATAYNTFTFDCIGDSFPGKPFPGVVENGQAVRIMTGAPLPKGSDAVLPCEFTQNEHTRVVASGEVSAGKHVGAVGEDVRRGAIVLRAGRIMRPQDLGVLSSIGCDHVRVVGRPRVQVLITGNELLPAGSKPHGYQITDSNGPMLRALLNRDGGLSVDSTILADNRDILRQALNDPADVCLISGGSSVGQDDFAPRILAEDGQLAIHGIAMRPSSPAGMGLLGKKIVFLLPGNPVSCFCAYDFFAGRAIRALSGRAKSWPYRRHAFRLVRKLVSVIGRVDYARVFITAEGADPIAISGASILTSITQADGFVIIPANSEGYAAGAEVDVFLY